MKPLTLLDTIITTTNFPQDQVLTGDLGTIVEIYTRPHLAYEVEFVNPDGTTRALLTLTPDQVRQLDPNDVITTRSLVMAA
ncbi:MAG: DUF4926 domain-containing protein [Chloroflexi bacterium]|nr:DUF4926 domain-containing protein [Chloroflexota bacterium]